MREYACHGVINKVCCTVADIRQVSYLNRATNLLDDNLIHSLYLTEQANFLGVRNPHIGVRVGSRAVRNYKRTQASRVKKRSGRDECVLHVSKY